MKKLVLFIVLQLAVGVVVAQSVAFKLNGGIEDSALKSKIEDNISALLTDFNAALASDRQVNFESISIAPDVKESINMLWENVRFTPIDEVVVERLLQTSTGYQVRNIPLTISIKGAEVSSADDAYQEAVMDIDKSGQIQTFYFAVSNTLYMQMMKSSGDVTDLRRRQLILDYVEHFRTSYNQKDLKFLRQVFSDDAIIITGKVITTKPNDMNLVPQTKITYNSMGKEEYLSRLTRVFANNKYISVKFSEIKVSRHPTKADYYGVLLHQGYKSDSYSDDGYVFLLWDFRNELQPQIHVRTWQPYYMDDAKSVTIAKEEVFDISSFDL